MNKVVSGHRLGLRSQYFIILLLCASASLRLDMAAQVRPVNDYGALGLGHLLNRLQTTASVMMIGAHPDDEDSALIAYLARRECADGISQPHARRRRPKHHRA